MLRYRRVAVVAVHIALWTLAFGSAFLLRFEFHIPGAYLRVVPIWLGMLIGIRVVVHWWFGLFHGLWRYSSSRDLIGLIKAACVSTGVFAVVVFLTGPAGLPRTIFIIDWLASIMVVGGLRFSVRAVREIAIQSAAAPAGERRKILIVGAGDAAELLMRDIRRVHGRRYEPVGFVDDNLHKVGERIHDVPVLGPIADVPRLVEEHDVQEIIIAMPSVTGKDMRRIVDVCNQTKVVIRTLPAMDQLIDGKVTVGQLKHVNIEDLLGREPVNLDTDAIAAFVKGAVVLVTGAGGSIGSELCRQICRFKPGRVILVEQAENNLFHIHRDLQRQHPELTFVPCVADICDTKRMEAIFSSEKPKVVFHAAAHKHVPMMECNPGEAIKNNVFGTKKVADLSAFHGVEKFVMVSTDKAVNPSSIMGVSKRVAEIYVQALSQRTKTHFITVRFGNVLGSAGSVIPIFQEQIARGGPVTVTHPEMCRYFMTIPEACQLILQAGAMGKGGEIFILDMGEPVKIVDLARDLIKLSGLVPGEDVEIQFSGIRPGEKLFEELAVDSEHATKTVHRKIFVGRFRPSAWGDVERALAELHSLSEGTDVDAVRKAFKKIVPEYLGGGTAAPDAPEKQRASTPLPSLVN